MTTFAQNMAFTQRFADQIRATVGGLLVAPATIEQDLFEATDFVIIGCAGKTVAAHMRRYGFAAKWPNEITIRSKVPIGRTELDKFLDGYGDILFYGHADIAHTAIDTYVLVDLDAFRWHWQHPYMRRLFQDNRHDGTGFVAIDLAVSHPPKLVIAMSERWRSK